MIAELIPIIRSMLALLFLASIFIGFCVLSVNDSGRMPTVFWFFVLIALLSVFGLAVMK